MITPNPNGYTNYQDFLEALNFVRNRPKTNDKPVRVDKPSKPVRKPQIAK